MGRRVCLHYWQWIHTYLRRPSSTGSLGSAILAGLTSAHVPDCTDRLLAETWPRWRWPLRCCVWPRCCALSAAAADGWSSRPVAWPLTVLLMILPAGCRCSGNLLLLVMKLQIIPAAEAAALSFAAGVTNHATLV